MRSVSRVIVHGQKHTGEMFIRGEQARLHRSILARRSISSPVVRRQLGIDLEREVARSEGCASADASKVVFC
jgi:hypothetical protein